MKFNHFYSETASKFYPVVTSIDGHPTGFYGTVDILRMKKLKFSGFYFFFENVIGTSF